MTLTATRPTGVLDATAAAAAAVVARVLPHRGQVAAVAAPEFAGRNRAWVMTMADGAPVFVKQVSDRVAGPDAYRRSVAFAEFAERHGDVAPRSPRLLAVDEPQAVLVFEHCAGTSLARLLVEERVPERFASDVGHQLARLHGGPVEGLLPTNHPSPPVDMLARGVPVSRYIQFTLAELGFWKELQGDVELVQAARDLRHWEDAHRSAPVHGDLRLDQFHWTDDGVRFLDWEEFGVGDPARDLGTLAGEWIYRAVLDTVTTRGGATAPPLRFDQASATARITERINHLAPRIREMWLAYAAASPGDDPGLPVRTVAQLGWHLVDRTIARAPMVSRLPGIERAAAGIGRRILLQPDRYLTALGFDGGTR